MSIVNSAAHLHSFVLGYRVQGLHSAPTLHPAALAAVSLACIENTTPHLQALCLGTFLKLICTQSQDSGIDFHTLVLENVSGIVYLGYTVSISSTKFTFLGSGHYGDFEGALWSAAIAVRQRTPVDGFYPGEARTPQPKPLIHHR